MLTTPHTRGIFLAKDALVDSSAGAHRGRTWGGEASGCDACCCCSEASTGTMARQGRMPCRGEAGVSSRCGSGSVSRNLRTSGHHHIIGGGIFDTSVHPTSLSPSCGSVLSGDLLHLCRKSTPQVNNAALPPSVQGAVSPQVCQGDEGARR